MLRLTPIMGSEFTRQVQALFARFHLDPAQAPNFLRILAKSPAVTEAYAGAEQALAAGQLTAADRERLALAVAEINDSKYCLVAHTLTSRDAGLGDEDIRLARKAAATDPKAEAMLRFTQAVVLHRGNIRDEALKAVREAGFSDAEVIEIVANIALNIFTNYLNLVANTEVDFPLLHPELKSTDAARGLAGTLCAEPCDTDQG